MRMEGGGSGVAGRFGVAALLALGVALACSGDKAIFDPTLIEQGLADAGAPDAAVPDAAVPIADVDIAGTWLGTLQLPGAPLRLVLNAERGENGAWTGTLDSPDQSALGIPITSLSVTGNRVEVRVDPGGIQYSGQVSADGQTLSGTFAQDGNAFPLTLKRQAGPLDYRRPQDPVPPFPYHTEDVTFASEAPGVTLAGTLTWPEGPGPFTTVALITGSGAQDRNEQLLNHRPFLVLADALARANVAVLR
ncbi:MAG TPA: hypothetical protein VJU61_27030, partial [Polyangiaceae bacterium]|nr:hypothetical protein [Polyangiaceae bacterium]